MKRRLRTDKQVDGYLQAHDWERCDVIAPVRLYLHKDLCPQWVGRDTALALTYQMEIDRLTHENERLRAKLKKARS